MRYFKEQFFIILLGNRSIAINISLSSVLKCFSGMLWKFFFMTYKDLKSVEWTHGILQFYMLCRVVGISNAVEAAVSAVLLYEVESHPKRLSNVVVSGTPHS